jgi:hypothetical protein
VIDSQEPRAAERASTPRELAVLLINVTEGYVVAEWSRRLGCTPGELRAIAALVGNVAADIEAHFRTVQHAAQQQDALRAVFATPPSSQPE